MRIALITLALVALGFIATIIFNIAGREGMISFPKASKSTEADISNIALETYKNQIKAEQKLEELTRKIEALSTSGNGTQSMTASERQVSQSTGSVLIPISGKFLSQVMPTLEFSTIDNNGIYDLHIFDLATEYSTYSDIKFGTVVVVTRLSYDTILKNFKALGNDVYSVNETKTFPFRSFYLNPPKSDTLVRIVIEIESQAIMIQIPKTKFSNLKTLLQKKSSK
ncbi:hypothetical protein KBD33_03560 [Candidatus Gracilibacteria bacterium]|nr:hypothetical protein [Candidatus Gracilibacteria bacterium]